MYVSHGDPDYYFGLGVIRDAFPDAASSRAARPSSTSRTAPPPSSRRGDRSSAPTARTTCLLPNVLEGDHLDLEGHRLEIIGLDSADARIARSCGSPTSQAVVGGVVVYGGLHLFTADTATPEARAAWGRTLETLAALHPSIVVPGHAAPGFPHDLSGVTGSQEYLQVFEQAVTDTSRQRRAHRAMTARFPDFGLPIALQLGAKVAKGEMTW